MLSVKCIPVGELQSNCYIVYNDINEALVIDPGADAKVIINFLESLNLNIDKIIFTHAHFDHIGAANEIVERYNCIAYLNNNDVSLLDNPQLNLSAIFGRDVAFKHNYYAFEDYYSERMIGENVTFISTPGHTPGSCCVKISNMIFTGDTLFRLSIGNEFPPYGNMKLEIKSIKDKLLSLDDEIICYPGHGESTTLYYERKNNPYLNHGELWI